MKKVLFLLCAAFAVMAFSAERAEAARMTILYGNGPEFQKMYNLPDSVSNRLAEEYEGLQVQEFGISFEQFSLFYVPIWNYGEREYALYDKDSKTIYPFTAEETEELEQLAKELGYELPNEVPGLSFWNRIGGKLVLLVVLAGIGGFLLWKKRQAEEAEGRIEE